MKSEAHVKLLNSWFFIAATRGRPFGLSKKPHPPLCPIVVSLVSYCTSCTRFIIHTGTCILYVIQPSEQVRNTYFLKATKRQNAETWQANREAAFSFLSAHFSAHISLTLLGWPVK